MRFIRRNYKPIRKNKKSKKLELRRIEKGIKNIVVLENCHSESYATEEITKLIAWRRNKSSSSAAMQHPPQLLEILFLHAVLKRNIRSRICSIIILPAEMQCANYMRND